jgi:hypothetical protein
VAVAHGAAPGRQSRASAIEGGRGAKLSARGTSAPASPGTPPALRRVLALEARQLVRQLHVELVVRHDTAEQPQPQRLVRSDHLGRVDQIRRLGGAHEAGQEERAAPVGVQTDAVNVWPMAARSSSRAVPRGERSSAGMGGRPPRATLGGAPRRVRRAPDSSPNGGPPPTSCRCRATQEPAESPRSPARFRRLRGYRITLPTLALRWARLKSIRAGSGSEGMESAPRRPLQRRRHLHFPACGSGDRVPPITGGFTWVLIEGKFSVGVSIADGS